MSETVGAPPSEPISPAPLSRLRRLMLAVLAVPLLGVSWAVMWTQSTYLNPLFFFGMWSGATLLMYAASERGYPGWRRHLSLMATSIPLWWWFELVNARVDNWEYIERYDYNAVEYAILASLAFSTVVPALHSAWRLTTGWLRAQTADSGEAGGRGYVVEGLLGLGAVVATFAWPDRLFPLVWVGPFLILDGLVGWGGGRSLAREAYRGGWRLPVAIGLAGLICGFLWEFWNYWSTPKWVYHIPYLEVLHVFEMPVLGYTGYVPFAWSVYQLTRIGPLRPYLGRL